MKMPRFRIAWIMAVAIAAVDFTLIRELTVRPNPSRELFLVGGLLFSALVLLNVYLAWRSRPPVLPTRRDDPAFRYRVTLVPVARPVVAAFTITYVFRHTIIGWLNAPLPDAKPNIPGKQPFQVTTFSSPGS